MDSEQRAVVPDEDLDRDVEEILAFGRQLGSELARRNRASGLPYRTDITLPDITDLLRADLRLALEDEVIPAVQIDPHTVINAMDVERDVLKKALIALKLETLRKVARADHLPTSGAVEDLASRIAAHLKWDPEKVALLVLEHTDDEAVRESGHTSRMFGIRSPIDLDVAAQQVQAVEGRYIRIGLARWFVFASVAISTEQLTLAGTVHSYVPVLVGDTESEDAATVRSEPSATDARLTVQRDAKVLEVKSSTAAGARAIVRAMYAALLGQPPVDVPMPDLKAENPLHRESVFMLDVLSNRVRSMGQLRINPTSARFRVGDSRPDDAGRRPVLKAVRFEGRHILDSRVACRLLAQERRGLVDISMDVAIQQEDEIGVFPVRLTLESDHVVLHTSFGRGAPTLAGAVHAAIASAVSEELVHGVQDEASLRDLAARIRDRADSSEEAAEADLF